NTTNTNVLRNVKAYIDGFLENTTDIEMKKIITEAGGEVLYSASNATHILTSQQLSGSKTHRLLTQKKMKVRPHVVRPEWVFDSLDRGRRVPEREYSVLKDGGNKGLVEMFGVGKDAK
ncbi:uncharacterized protein STEHIDRAFT_65046, partial [Stereum hirsutum FP-91666 SS1]|uniref:uncharacterized protein n=1 Tax=Stereum hirsutum (strain FP-91666) TaxID=721885 RepID=UPI00044498FA